MSNSGLYMDMARYYDLIYHWKDYVKETAQLRQVLHAHGVPDGSHVLEAACGTGHHMSLLSEHFQVSGFDLNDGMLAVARARTPPLNVWQADMRSFQVDRPYDAITCLFSAIGYLMDLESVRAAARSFAAALRPGGLLVVEPWLTMEQWDVGRPNLQTFQSPDLQLARATVADRRGDVAVMAMNWLIVERGKPVRHVVDLHESWMCPRETMRLAFQDAGFEARFEPDGLMKDRGLFLGVRR